MKRPHMLDIRQNFPRSARLQIEQVKPSVQALSGWQAVGDQVTI